MSPYNIPCFKLILFTIFIFTSVISYGQSPYELSWKKDAPLLGGGMLGQITAFGLIVNKITPLTVEEIEALNRNDINSFDRKVTDDFSSKSRGHSDLFLYSSLTYPFLLMLDKNMRQDFIPLGVMTLEAVVINGAMTTLIKGLAKRPRPFMYNPAIDLEQKQNRNGQLSFYSGHTSNVAALSFFTAKVFTDYYPESKWKPAVWTVAAILPAATGYLRVKGGKHFPTDVMTGYIAGGLVGYLIPQIHKKKDQNQKLKLSLLSEVDRIGFVLTW